MEALNVVCTWDSQRRTFYFQISSLFCFSHFPAGIQRNEFIMLILYTNIFWISNLFRFFQIQVCRCYSSAEPRVLQGILTLWFHFCGNDFKGTTLARWDVKLLWNSTHVCGMSVPLCSVLYLFFPIYSSLHSPFTALKKGSGIVGMQEECFHSAAIKPQWIEGLLFCFVLFFWCDIEFLALGCTSGQTIIAFSSLGSSLFSIWSLPPSDFTIKRRGCSRGKEDNSWISHLIWAAREAWRTLTMNPEIACQGLPETQEKI